jgi:hypothetical protein
MGDEPSLDPSTSPSPSTPAESETPDPAACAAPCRNLRNKGMYVYHGEYATPHEDYDNTIYWCVRTQKGFGPDDEFVSREDCTNPERACYEPL